ncbi:antitoxin PaaA2 family protein [Massilia antarctica]|uniref:antitoxin PaaA2 family protein n=1 Tax=Massilia antarctica TaxID=2765360 RepID=UPI0035EFD4C1
MTTDTIDHTTLTKLAEAGVVRSAHVVGQAGGWGILVKYGMTERALAAQRSQQVRIFRKLETLVEYLKGVGIARFDVDAVNYDSRSITATKRPDRAAAMKDAHAAAAYTKWLKAEVQEALDDTSPTIPHDEAMRQVRAAIKLA